MYNDLHKLRIINPRKNISLEYILNDIKELTMKH